MKFKSLDENIIEVDKKIPVSVCLEKQDAERWEFVKQKLKAINKKAHIADFARKSIASMLDNLENLIEQHEEKRKGA